MNNLIDQNVKLFLYDLRNGLGQSFDEIEKNKKRFKERLPKEIKESISFRDDDFEADYVQLLGDGKKRIKKFAPGEQYEGYYYPVRLGDTYGLLLDCSVKNQTNPDSVSCFTELKKEIDQRLNIKNKPATIGQTWMLSAVLDDSEDPESLAKECYKKAFIDGEVNDSWWKDLQVRKGNLFGGNIFEVSQYRLLLKEETNHSTSQDSQKPSIQKIQQNHHVIICLFDNKDNHEKLAKIEWMRLFYYRHKILFFSAQSRYLKQQLKKHFIDIQNGINDIKEASFQKIDAKKLRTILEKAQKTLSEYSINISYFESQLLNVGINLDSYKKRLIKIQELAKPSDLEFLHEFSNYVQDIDLVQLQKDYENLRPGLELIKGLINSSNFVSSIIQVDQQERDRRFQKNVAIVGVGVSGASLMTSASILSAQYAPHIVAIKDLTLVNKFLPHLPPFKTPKDQKTDSSYAVVAISFSIFTAIIFGLITHIIIKIRKG